jgi:C4-dicarboxylate-specific signal transduction histidine kinase
MVTSTADRPRRSPRPNDTLVLSVCHEVGNLLAAARLTAHLLRRGPSPREIEASSRTIEALSGRAGALIAQIRPLLEPRVKRRVRQGVTEVLDGVEHVLAERPGGASISIVRPARGAEVAVDPDALHHTLVVLILAACDAAGPRGRVDVSISAGAGRVIFSVRDDGPPFAPGAPGGEVRRGRDLVLALARGFAEREGGALALRRAKRGTEVRVALVAAPPAKPISAAARRPGAATGRVRAAAAKPAAPAAAKRRRAPRGPRST